MRHKIQLYIFILFTAFSAFNVDAIIIKNKTEKTCQSIDIIKSEITQFINEARSRPRRCGNKSFPASHPVSWNDKLFKAALKHSKDMARHNFLSHTGSDRSNTIMRIELSGYVPIAWGENISGGHSTSRDVVNRWLNSPDHCSNIMNPDFTEIGSACVQNESTDYKTYWTLIFTAPR